MGYKMLFVLNWAEHESYPANKPQIRRVSNIHSFMVIDHEIFSNHSLPSADSRMAVVSFWQKNVHK